MNADSPVDSSLILIARTPSPLILAYFLNVFQGWKIVLVSPIRPRWLPGEVTFHADDDLILRSLFISNWKGGRAGWYYQQFLKYEAVLKSSWASSLIVDGDSVISPRIPYRSVCTTGQAIQRYYNSFCEKCLPDIFPRGRVKKSMITNQMYFVKNELQEMLGAIERQHGDSWMSAIERILLNYTDLSFSEYQLYGGYRLHARKASLQKIKVFRRMDCIDKPITDALRKYHVISFEPQHKTGFLRKIRATGLYSLGMDLG